LSIHLTIVTPEGEAYSGDVEQVVLPGSEGDFGVLEHHERYLAPLRVGAVEIITSGGSAWAAVTDGFADVSAENVVVMVDSYHHSADLDQDHLGRELERWEEELRGLSGGEEDAIRRSEIEDAVVRDSVLREVALKK